jgi:DNA-binding response OmpR family regulator
VTNLRPILLAEDDPNDAELTLTAFKKHNVLNEVVVVSDGAETLDYLYCRGKFQQRKPGAPAVVLLDLKMPKVDGLEGLRVIKQDAHMKSVPIVMLTSSREGSDLVMSYGLGANAYVVKPVNFTSFVSAVQELGTFWGMLNEPLPKTLGKA